MKAKHRIISLLLSVLVLLTLFPTSALAEPEQTVTIQSEKNNAFDYLEYLSGSGWKDLNTPRHWITSTGEVCYCIEHSEDTPHNDTYTAASPSSVFSPETLAGLQTILMFGYPCSTPDGFTEDEARQATANAIRFWLSENNEPGSYSFTNRREHPTHIRAKKGYEHVLAWADELLEKARNGETLSHSISFSPSAVNLVKTNTYYTGTTDVTLVNINAGYTLDYDNLLLGVMIGGYSGMESETLSITVPSNIAGQTFTITATGSDTRALSNITAYIPADDSLQKIFLCATTAQVVSTASVGVNTPALGELRILKKGEGGQALSGVAFGVYRDAGCTDLVLRAVTDSSGSVILSDLDAGAYYVRELETVSPYVLDGMLHSVSVTAGDTAVLELENDQAKGQIRIEKTAEMLTGTRETETDYGTMYVPVYENSPLSGCVFEIKNSAGTTVATLTTDGNGAAETGLLPFGTYTVTETSVPEGYEKDSSPRSVTLSYQDSSTPIVRSTIEANNERVETKVRLKKTTEFFDKSSMEFVSGPLEDAVFGLFTAENIGMIPANTMTALLVTGSDGIAETSSPLPMGNYYLRELAVPESDIHLSAESYPLTLAGTNTDYYETPIQNERFKGSIAVWKYDGSSEGRTLPGAMFEIRDSSGLLYDTITGDENGMAKSRDLPVGTYYIYEAASPSGFALTEGAVSVTITTENKSMIEVEMENWPNCAVLSKYDLTNRKPVPGAVIEVVNEAGETVFTGETDSHGEIVLIELPTGDYTFRETIAPAGYALNTESFAFSIDSYGNVGGTDRISDEPTTLVIEKTDGYTGQPMEGVEFRLLDSDGQTVRTVPYVPAEEPGTINVKSVKEPERVLVIEPSFRVWARDGEDTFTTDENGRVEFRYLPVGAYTLEEITPSGYASHAPVTFTLTDRHGVNDPLVLSVENRPTGLVIRKIDGSSNNPLSGAGFAVKVQSGDGFETLHFKKVDDNTYYLDSEGQFTDMITGASGNLTVLGLPEGTVWIEETVTPEGYFPISAQKAVLTSENTDLTPLELVIKNYKFVKLGMDSDWWEFPALCLALLLLVGAGITVTVILVRKRKRT